MPIESSFERNDKTVATIIVEVFKDQTEIEVRLNVLDLEVPFLPKKIFFIEIKSFECPLLHRCKDNIIEIY